MVQAESGSAHIKNVGSPVHAWRLLAVGEHQPGWSNESPLVGRIWKLNTVTAILDEAGVVPGVSSMRWCPGCGKPFDGKASSPGTGLGATQEGPGSGLRMMRGGRRRPSRRMTGKPGGATLNDCWNQVAGFGGRRP